jgi:hypothetical protein
LLIHFRNAFANASAALFEFGCITNNSGDCGSIASLLSLEVTDEGGGETLFNFSVAAGDNAAVKEIFFDDAGGLLDFSSASFDESDGIDPYGVDFKPFMEGGNLPAGNTVDFDSTFFTKARSPSGDDKYGIDNGESLGISFFGTDFDTILAAIRVFDLGIGVHVGSVGDGYEFSESLTVVPVPAAFWLFGSALIGFIGLSRKISV